MPLAVGTKLGPYEVVSALGAGGMGEVYRARDTRLGRDVAIKILPKEMSADPTRKQRFEREAKTISGLNHPHICVLHDVGSHNGVDYLVMECMEGETLAKRLEKGPLALEQVLKYGTQIADALDRAHRSGVVHRDLKPANIMLTASGAKLLDFGLAKPAMSSINGAALTATLTQSTPATKEGTIVGTFQYMSPEQVEGKEVDGRSDIFSLGAVLYEMVTGKKAFEGKSQLSVASAILEKEPAPITAAKPLTPPTLEHAINRCLAKDPDDRWQAARDLGIELKWVAEATEKVANTTPERRTVSSWLLTSVGAIIVLTIIAISWAGFRLRGGQPGAAVARFELSLKATDYYFAVSPDGRWLSFTAPGPDKRLLIWIRALESLEPRPLVGTENVFGPSMTWSPDSRFIAFQTGNELKKIKVSGGPPERICEAPYVVLGGAWNRDDTLLFGTVVSGLIAVSGQGGAPRFVTSTSKRNEVHVFPFFLPDGHHFGYLRAPENPGIYIGSLDLKADQQNANKIVGTPVMAGYAPAPNGGGHLLFMQEGSLMVQTLDEKRLALTGEPVTVAENVSTYLLSASFSASNGVLVYRAGRTTLGPSTLAWFDRKGQELGPVGDSGSNVYQDVAISPDASHVAISKTEPTVTGSSQGIWLLDLSRGVSARFTFDVAPDTSPVWSPDGSRIAYAGSRAGGMGIYEKAANGSSTERTLVSPVGEPMYPTHWSRDGRFLLYSKEAGSTRSDLWVMPLSEDGTPAGQSIPFATTKYSESDGMFSPDGHWVAYTSDESGKEEVYLRSFPASQGEGIKIQTSRNGGRQPHWRGDGKELFYLSPDRKMMAVEVSRTGPVRLGAPTSLFELPAKEEQSGLSAWPWDVTTDGKRFLIGKSNAVSEPVTVVLNWRAELDK